MDAPTPRRRPVRKAVNALRDETYRAMLRLEGGRPDAAPLLCDALLTAWRGSGSVEEPEQFGEWLRKVTPVCLEMLYASTHGGYGKSASAQDSRPPNISKRKLLRENMEIKVAHLDHVRFSIQTRGHTIISDQPVEAAGNDTGMTPPELLLASLGSCAAFYAAQYLKIRKLAESGVEVTVHAEKLKQPSRIGNFLIQVACPVPLSEEQKQGMMRAVHQCLVHNTLLNPPEIAIQLTTESPTEAQVQR